MDGVKKFLLVLAVVVTLTFVYLILYATGVSIAICLTIITAFTYVIAAVSKAEIEYRS